MSGGGEERGQVIRRGYNRFSLGGVEIEHGLVREKNSGSVFERTRDRERGGRRPDSSKRQPGKSRIESKGGSVVDFREKGGENNHAQGEKNILQISS